MLTEARTRKQVRRDYSHTESIYCDRFRDMRQLREDTARLRRGECHSEPDGKLRGLKAANDVEGLGFLKQGDQILCCLSKM